LWLAFAVAHIPLALLMQRISIVTYAHGVVVFGLGMWWALTSNQLHRVAWVGAYVIGSEVLWRMTTDALPWEAGKYMQVALFGTALLNAKGVTSLGLPALLFLPLLPSASLTISASEYAVWREQLSFNLSGPFALALAAGFFSRVHLTSDRLLRLFLFLVAPILGIAGIVVKGILTAEVLTFSTQSNFALSGGFGPNQVSLVLGLGGFAALWCVLEAKKGSSLRMPMFIIMIWLAVQSALTFSRGGFLGAAGASAVAIGFLMTVPQIRKQLFVVVALVVVLGTWVIWPMLQDFTGGAIADRYGETDMTGREIYGRQDLATFEEHPLFGVGPGRSAFEHTGGAVTHTEFTRLLAEHGSFGVFSIAMMVAAFLYNIYRGPTAREKALAASVMVWTLLYMSNAAMRTGAPSYMFGLGFCTFAWRPTVARSSARAARRLLASSVSVPAGVGRDSVPQPS